MLKKDITFIYKDSAEKSSYEPIFNEAKKRGYKVKLTDNEFEKCEIGFYCQHVNFPKLSKFSVIILHDIIQQYGNWPNIWYYEPWNKYDIGILPSKQWVDNWNQCSQFKYTRPKKGMYKVGWPKADYVNEIKSKMSKEQYCLSHGMDPKKRTILYAPAWENDGKQDDFVQAMKKLDVNILIKQGPWNSKRWLEERPDIAKNVEEMKKLHEGIPGVTILEPSTNIFEAIAVSDVLVSEESSTMCEAAMMSIPAVSVSDWLIPDSIPSRYPECNYDFVIMTTKDQLTNCIDNIISDYSEYKKRSEEFCQENFCNIGKSAQIIMDIIDDCVEKKSIRYEALAPNLNEKIPLKENIAREKEQLRRYVFGNWCIRSKTVNDLCNFLRKVKQFHVKEEIQDIK